MGNLSSEVITGKYLYICSKKYEETDIHLFIIANIFK